METHNSHAPPQPLSTQNDRKLALFRPGMAPEPYRSKPQGGGVDDRAAPLRRRGRNALVVRK